MNFTLNTKKQQEEMLKEIGVEKINDLFKDIPKKIFLKEKMGISSELSEQEVKNLLTELSLKNANASTHSYFLGAGVYNHFIPSAVWALASRSEFLTAYTPYQPEISQGMLQSIFEWQTFICELTGMDATNASTYDGAEAFAEAVLMTRNMTRKNKVLVSKAVNPEYLKVAKTYASANEIEVVEIDFENGITSVEKLKRELDESVAGVFVQHPNFFGCLENLRAIGVAAKEKNAVLTVAVGELLSAGLLKPPCEFGANIAVGEAQSFGLPMNFGGPHCGFIAVKMKNVRQLSGRIVGKTIDSDGKKGYILTLQAREQHIRREKATSNICTNQALFALAATIHLSLLGKKGVKALAQLNLQLAHYAFEKLTGLNGVESVFSQPFFNEFVIKVLDAKKVQEKLLEKKIVFGLALEKEFPELKDHLLVAVTEMNSLEKIDEIVKEMESAL